MTRLGILVATALLAATAHAAPQAAPSQPHETAVSPSLAWQIEATFRAHATLPDAAEIHIGPLKPAPFPNFDLVEITVATQGQAYKPLEFLLSTDRTQLIQYRPLALDPNPRASVSQTDRPARGGPADAPVLIVGFDDLECPFCAQLNQTIFPAILTRYKDQVRVVYRDFPSDGHPWALRAAIDTNCLAEQNADAYWQAVDQIHLEAHTIDTTPANTVQNASHTIDSLIRNIAEHDKLNLTTLNACVEQQNPKDIEASIREGRTLNVGVTPTFFINGAKIEGAVPLAFIFQMIDNALVAQGKTPPPQ